MGVRISVDGHLLCGRHTMIFICRSVATMKAQEILELLPQLSISERLTIVEAALRLIQQDQERLTSDEQIRQLAAAALAAKLDYGTGSELLAFKSLDGEDFYEYSSVDFVPFDLHAEK